MGCLSERSADGRVSSFPMKDLNTGRNATHLDRNGDYPVSLIFINLSMSFDFLVFQLNYVYTDLYFSSTFKIMTVRTIMVCPLIKGRQ